MKKAAHFLLLASLEKSPPNDALTRAYNELETEVDFYAPDMSGNTDANRFEVSYGIKWLAKNLVSSKWRAYDYFSCTSEDPVVIAGVLSVLYRKPLIFLSDEIKSGSYRGDRPNFWKKLCRWAMRRASVTIVNDESRVQLQKEYAKLSNDKVITVYPGCFLEPPIPCERQGNQKEVVMTYSGGFNMTGGVSWALKTLSEIPSLHMLVQPLGVSELDRLLLEQHKFKDRIEVSSRRLNWQEAWTSMGNADIGIAIYHNDSPQFQNMGISSNRLCMFIAMGVPIITSKQDSFKFVEEYDCGVMVESAEEFTAAVKKISANLPQMKLNATRCFKEYIDTPKRYQTLLGHMRDLSK